MSKNYCIAILCLLFMFSCSQNNKQATKARKKSSSNATAENIDSLADTSPANESDNDDSDDSDDGDDGDDKAKNEKDLKDIIGSSNGFNGILDKILALDDAQIDKVLKNPELDAVLEKNIDDPALVDLAKKLLKDDSAKETLIKLRDSGVLKNISPEQIQQIAEIYQKQK